MPSFVPEDLSFELASAAKGRLESLLDEWLQRLDLKSLRALLDNPFCDETILRRVYAEKHLISLYSVRALLIRHRALPLALALQIVPGLFWRDLVALSQETRIRPQLRRAADLRLLERLPGLAVGERVNLARRASARLITQLGRDPNPRVCRALLENPRLSEGLIIPWVSGQSATPQILRVVAKSPRWSVRYPIRLALCRNSNTPPDVVLPLLPLLKRSDLQAIASDHRLTAMVRRRADLLMGR